MLIAYYKVGMKDVRGTMEAFTRKLPKHRRFLVACGIERILEYLQKLRITDKHIKVLKQVLPDIEFDEELCSYLTGIDFAKELDVMAMQDGDLLFANEPVISITGPIGIAQYPEKKILSILNHDIRIASKAARIYLAAKGKPVAEFGGRRGADGMSAEAARAAFIAGFSSSSNVLAFERYGIPCSGTMGHVWVMSHLGPDGEDRAYKNWGIIFKNSTFLPDTYNLITGTEKVLNNCHRNIGSIRLDVDNLKESSFSVKRRINSYDAMNVTIGATNDLNEYKIKELISYGCPIDWFGVGTEVVSTPDAPTCNFVYKLVEVNDPVRGHEFVAKNSDGGKATIPGAKQVFRGFAEPSAKIMTNDIICLSSEDIEDSNHKPLMLKYNIQSWSKDTWPAQYARDLFLKRMKQSPDYLKVICYEEQEGNIYPVDISDRLQTELTKFRERH
jgi:nicotinate phosphoribosyltransferase